VLVATAVPFRDGEVDLEGYADHVRWLTENGC
jgi:dihydrodipicolinate synthase/N-acetylneuraminate lyase